MATTKATKAPAKKYDGPSPAEKMVTQLVELMEKGVNPWRREWKGSGAHRNMLTGHVYTGSNPAILEWGQAARGSDYSLWVGPGMAKSKGWYPKKGSKGCYILAPKPIAIESENEQGETELSCFTLFKPQCLFNVSDLQGEGLEDAIKKALDGVGIERPEDDRLADAFKQLRSWKVKTNHGGDRAYYSPIEDYIQMPERK